MYLNVVINIPVNKQFTYNKPKEITDDITGYRVMVPFRNRTLKAIVVSSTSDKPEFKTLPIKAIIDSEPIATQKEFELAKWMSGYYNCSFGEALFACLPAGAPAKRDKKVLPIPAKKTEYHDLNDEQCVALNSIVADLRSEKRSTFLLHGVTGSGKTEVYLQAIKEALALGQQAIIILPEISLTPQTIERFAERFEGRIAVLHSKLSQTEKYRYWQLIRKDEIKIIVGARSAIFSPTKNLGIIVVDEEHENTYKSSDTPRYHARQIAFYRSKKENATLILGSATPSIETFYHAQNSASSHVKLLSLTKRAASIHMPTIEIVNMKESKKVEMLPLMSTTLFKNINQVLEKKEQVILFLNRKGYAPIVTCSHCNDTLECPHCSVTLTYHKAKDVVMCHYCGYTQKVATKCEKCNIGNMEKKGFGTEKIEGELALLFPKATIQRVDQDSVNTPKAYTTIFKAFGSGEIDILVGTQILAKGLDFPNVTLVGILSADSSLHIPDFRSSERTFNLITQVAGRSGRGDKLGKVIIQTYSPTHRSIEYAKSHDYNAFYDSEIVLRETLRYPPFSRLVRIVVRGIKEPDVIDDANAIADLANAYKYQSGEQGEAIEILGASECVMSKLKKYYRWNILLKSQTQNALKPLLAHINNDFLARKGNYIEIDVDPISMV